MSIIRTGLALLLSCLLITTTTFTQERGPWYLIGRTPPAEEPDTPGGDLITEANWDDHFTYLGVIRAPVDYGYISTGISYNPENDSLIVVSDDIFEAEITIPTPVITTTLASIPRASVVTGAERGDYTFGLKSDISAGTAGNPAIAGTLPYNDRILISGYNNYNEDGSGSLSHILRIGPTLGNIVAGMPYSTGPFRVGDQGAGRIGGPMALVPMAWQALLGGPVAGTSVSGIPGVTRTSLGPTVITFDPDAVDVDMPYTATNLLAYFPSTFNLLYNYNVDHNDGSMHPLFNATAQVGGLVVCPVGSRSVLLFGMVGHGGSCYGEGDYMAWMECDDPTNPSKGEHAYPYVMQVWMYDADDLALVKAGMMDPWDLTPTYWTFESPFTSYGLPTIGAAYDVAGARLFIAQKRAGGSDDTLIMVFAVE